MKALTKILLISGGVLVVLGFGITALAAFQKISITSASQRHHTTFRSASLLIPILM